jgi:hypothetical protein
MLLLLLLLLLQLSGQCGCGGSCRGKRSRRSCFCSDTGQMVLKPASI